MDDYNQYVTSVNKIFDYLEKLKAGWNSTDNKNYIDTISSFKNVVISKADEIKKPPTIKLEKTSAQLLEEQKLAEEAAIMENARSHQSSPMPEAVEEQKLSNVEGAERSMQIEEDEGEIDDSYVAKEIKRMKPALDGRDLVPVKVPQP